MAESHTGQHRRVGRFRLSAPLRAATGQRPGARTGTPRASRSNAAIALFVMALRDYPGVVGTLRAIIDENDRLAGLVRCLLEHDPNEPAGDDVQLLDLWRAQARAVFDEPDPAGPHESLSQP